MRSVTGGDTDVYVYFQLKLAATGADATGLVITDIDMQYTRAGAAAATKVDAIVGTGGAATHVDGKVFEIDATSSPGLYMACFPDAAFAAGAQSVILTLKEATITTVSTEVVIDPPVDVTKVSGDATAANNLELMYDGTGYTADTAPASRLQVEEGKLLSGTATASSTTSKVFVQAGDPPSGGADDDYNNTIIVVYRGTDKATSRVNVGVVSDYDDSDPSFTLTTAIGFTPQAGDLVEIYAGNPELLAATNKIASGFGTTSPDRLVDHFRAVMSKVATAPASTGTFNPATDSLEVLGEGVAAMEGVSFDTSTDSLQAIRDTIDTLLAPSVVSSSALSGSGFLSDCVSLIRKSVDEPSTTPKYTDSDIVELIQGGFEVVLQDISINTDHPMLVRLNLSVVDGKQAFTLPPQCGAVWALRKIDTVSNTPTWEVWPKGQLSFHGSGFALEGNTLRLNMDWNSSETLQLLYEPNGETAIHKATASAIDTTTVTFPTSVTDGTLDTREQAYAGYMIRILSSTEGIVEERMIISYDNDTRIATVSEAFTKSHTGTVVYEVVPQYTRLLKHVVCLRASLDILANEGNSQKIATLERSYQVKLSALRREVSRKQARFPGYDAGDVGEDW